MNRTPIFTVVGDLLTTLEPHGLPAGEAVFFVNAGGALPPEFEGGVFFVLADTTTTLRVARKRGGAPVSVSGPGTGTHQIYVSTAPASVQVHDHLKAWFAARGATEIVDFGRRARTKQINQQVAPDRAGRIVVMVGDETGKAGRIEALKELMPNALYAFPELVELSIWAADRHSLEDPMMQYWAAWRLWELVMVALRDMQAGRLGFGDLEVTTTPVERVYGCELVQPVVLFGGLVQKPQNAVVNVSLGSFSSAAVFPTGDYYTPPLSP